MNIHLARSCLKLILILSVLGFLRFVFYITWDVSHYGWGSWASTSFLELGHYLGISMLSATGAYWLKQPKKD